MSRRNHDVGVWGSDVVAKARRREKFKKKAINRIIGLDFSNQIDPCGSIELKIDP